MTGNWGGGYVTDVPYLTGYFISQSPQMLALCCLINGVAVDPPWENPRLHYLELGCGRGMNACVLAASNPGWQVTGIDFMPGAVADARRLAAEAGLENITFIEADLASFADSPAAAALAEVDVISAHGVWSWVGDAVRAGIVRLAAARLRAGGMFHVSYNALPAQQDALALQRVLREAGRRVVGRSDRQAMAGREVVQALVAAKATNLIGSETVREMVGRLERVPAAYLAHEYMNAAWRPCWHADVAADLAGAKLEFVGHARLVENFVDMMLTPEQREVHDRFDDPMMRELVIDTCINRTLHHDVYVRGASRMAAEERDAMLGRVRLALATTPEEFSYVLTMPAGEATVSEASYRPMVAALAEGPRSIAELIAARGPAAPPANPGEVAMVLAGTYQAMVVRDGNGEPDARAHRFNLAVARRMVRLDDLNATSAMASARVGAGFACRAAETLIAAHLGALGAAPDPAALAASMVPEGPQRQELAGLVAKVLHDRLAVWQRLGIV